MTPFALAFSLALTAPQALSPQDEALVDFAGRCLADLAGFNEDARLMRVVATDAEVRIWLESARGDGTLIELGCTDDGVFEGDRYHPDPAMVPDGDGPALDRGELDAAYFRRAAETAARAAGGLEDIEEIAVTWLRGPPAGPVTRVRGQGVEGYVLADIGPDGRALAVPTAVPEGLEPVDESAELALESDPVRGNPAREPLAAWAAGIGVVEAGGKVRRIAFAGHGLFVFHLPPSGNPMKATFLRWQEGAYVADETEARDSDLCEGPGIAPEAVRPALEKLLARREWREVEKRVDSLILECLGGSVRWTIVPVPEGGFQEGVAIQTVNLPFEG